MSKIKKLIAIAALGLCFFAVCAIFCFTNINVVSASVENQIEYDYLLPLSRYTFSDYDAGYSVFDSTGKQIEIHNKSFIATEIGDYKVLKNDKLVRIIRVFAKHPEAARFSVLGEMPTQCIAGQKITLPAVEIESDIEKAETYDIKLIFANETIASFLGVNEPVDYRVKKIGNYSIQYSFINVFGVEESKSYPMTSVNEKILIVENELPTSWTCYSKYDLSNIYGYFNEIKYDAVFSVVAPNQTPVKVVDEAFTPLQVGKYSLTISVNVEGTNLTQNLDIQVNYGYASLFYEGSGVGYIKNDVPTAQDYLDPSRGVEVMLIGEDAHVYYNKIIDLDTLTKDDSILTFYFDVAKTSATKIRATLIDVNDEKNQVGIYWWHSPWNNNKNSFMLAEFNGYSIGVESGAIREIHGKTLNSSFKRTDNESAFNFSYDAAENKIYTKMGKTLSMLIDLDDTALLGTRVPFKGFSSNQVYLKIELLERAEASIIISEIAGEKITDTTEIQTKNEQYLRLYYDGEYLKVGTLHTGAFGYFYALPVPETKDLIGGEIDVSVKFYKTVNGQKAEITDQIKSDWKFLPKELGQYKISYSCTDFYGNTVKKEYEFSVVLFASGITITNSSFTEKFGSLVSAPIINAVGGTGKLHAETEYYYNGERIETNKNGCFYLDKSGSITVKTCVTDFLGESAEKTFEIIVDSDVQELRIEEKPISFIAGREYVLPDFSPVNYQYKEGEAGRDLSKTIKVNGVTIGSDRKYTFQSAGTATITYIGDIGGAKEISETITVNIIPDTSYNTLPLQDYLIFNKEVETFLFESGLGINSEEDFEILMPNAIPLSAFQFAFTAVENLTNYSKLQFLIEDYKNPDKQLLIEIFVKDNGTFTLSLNNGMNYTLTTTSGTYAASAETIAAGYSGRKYNSMLFKLYDEEALITEENDVKICEITEYLSGKPYEGFDSGLMRLIIKVCGVSQKTAFVINGVSNQKTSSVAFMRGDKAGAAVALMGKTQKQAKLNDTVILPYAIAYDILQGKAVSLTGYVQLPDNSKRAFDPATPTEFTVTKYGSYRVVYEATDYYGNVGKYEYFILCNDTVNPIVYIPSGISLTYNAGDVLTITDFKAEDNVGVALKAVMVKTPANKYVVVDKEFTFTGTGNYEIIFYAQDENGNSSTKSLTVEVK